MTEVKVVVDGVAVVTKRYVGYKELMPYINRGRHAIRRLEKNHGFPTRRIKGARGRVFFYAEEVEKWLANPDNRTAFDSEKNWLQSRA